MAWVVFSYQAFRSCGCNSCVLVVSHMDEVGFMVSEIKADGTFPCGWNRWLESHGGRSSQRFKLYSWLSWNSVFQALFLHIWLPERAGQPPAISDIVLMVVLRTRLRQQKAGIRLVIKLLIAPLSWQPMKNIISKAWDNRHGKFMVSELAKPYLQVKNWEMNSNLALTSKKKLGLWRSYFYN